MCKESAMKATKFLELTWHFVSVNSYSKIKLQGTEEMKNQD